MLNNKANINFCPKISIITVCYNEKEVEKTLKSITGQTFQDFEWIVIDGNSNPETLAILKKYQNRMNVFISEEDTGIYNAMNKGIQLSNGEWLIFLNAGDVFFDEKTLEKILNHKDLFKNSDVIYCNSAHYTDYNDTEGQIIKYLKPEELNLEFWRQNCLSHASCLIKKELFNNSLYNENYKISADFEKWILWKKENRNFKYLDIIVSKYYKTGLSSENIALREEERKAILNKYLMKDYETIFTLKLFKKILLFKIQKRRDKKFLKFYIFKIPILIFPILRLY